MSRLPRVDHSEFVCHVLNRANAGAAMFVGEDDFKLFEGLLAQERTSAHVDLYAWCLLPDHWHLVIRPLRHGALQKFVRRLTQRHAQLWHKSRRTRGDGHLYKDRYRSFPVQMDDHFLTVCRYVERNPVRAGLVARASEWPHSSLGRVPLFAPALRPDLWPVRRPRDWSALVEAWEPAVELQALRTSVARCRPFGDPQWVLETVRQFGLSITLNPRGRPPKKPDATLLDAFVDAPSDASEN